METKGGVTRSRDSKDFFEEKQLVTLRPNTRWRAIAEHANLLRLMPRTDVHWCGGEQNCAQIEVAAVFAFVLAASLCNPWRRSRHAFSQIPGHATPQERKARAAREKTALMRSYSVLEGGKMPL
ncbi:hypothetical protein NDU88_001147 [Pleurodeles waltl]|uniref:Uncharacterized protein n=1 Tax=Pleurodeles waltl TaxID=8319 RepID=A0AAV7U5J6_PLEWA|nr:hypothetical protein NDU88_001147 [Pleurodeles waltl]